MRNLLAVLFLFFSHYSFAAVTVPATIWYNTSGQSVYTSGSTNFSTTIDQACQRYIDTSYGSGQYVINSQSYTGSGTSSGTCYVNITNRSSSTTTNQSQVWSAAHQCPSGFTIVSLTGSPSGWTCQSSSCPTNTTANASGQCIDNCASNKGQPYSLKMNGSSGSPSSGSQVCASNNCVASISTDFAAQVGGSWFGTASGTYTGASCSGQTGESSFSNPSNSATPTESPQTACIAAGQSFGTVNGQVVCVPISSSSATPLTSSNQTTTSNTNINSNGTSVSNSSTSNTSVSVNGDQVTTVTTINKSDGTSQQQTQTQSTLQYCQSNPNSFLCASSSSSSGQNPTDTPQNTFTGDCTSNFSCSGDAIQCAMVTKQYAEYCDAVSDNPDRDALLQAESDTSGKTLNDFLPTTTFNLPTDLQGQKLLGSSCIADMTFTYGGFPITLPLSKLCPYLEFCGLIVKLFSYLFGAIIIFGRRGS